MPEAPPRSSYAIEMRRKALHLVALVLPVAMVVFPDPWDVIILGGIGLLALAADIARARNAAVKRFIERTFGGMMRREELPPLNGRVAVNGATWMCLAAGLCALLFPASIGASAMAILILGDAAAAAVGMHVGRIRYPWSRKTLEGSLAFAVTAVVAAIPFAVLGQPPLGPGVVIIAAVAGGAVEALPLPINDNLLVPIVVGGVMMLLA